MDDKGFYFPFRDEYAWAFLGLQTDEAAGRLLRAVLNYRLDGELPQFEGSEKHLGRLFAMIRAGIDRDLSYYQDKREINRKNALSRWKKVAAEHEEANSEDADAMRSHTDAYGRTPNGCNLTLTELESNFKKEVKRTYLSTGTTQPFDPDILKRQISTIYQEIDSSKSGFLPEEQAFSTVKLFFNLFRDERGTEHPPIKSDALRRILVSLPETQGGIPLSAADYSDLIPGYFKESFNDGDCDYSIHHFLSGQIRDNLYGKYHQDDVDYYRHYHRRGKPVILMAGDSN